VLDLVTMQWTKLGKYTFHTMDRAVARLIALDTSTPTIVSLLILVTTITPKGLMPTFTWTGQVYCRFSFRHSLKPLPVQSVSAIR